MEPRKKARTDYIPSSSTPAPPSPISSSDIISDASSDEVAAPPDSQAAEIADPPVSPIGGITDLSDSSSGEVVALTDSSV
ncbi:hypothetical protein JHK82_031606 [Glycine max]|nr:hypothetical protein JHK82_031606 [Glycine max]